MNQEYSNANIEELKIINENIKDAKYMDNGVELKINQGANGFVLYNK